MYGLGLNNPAGMMKENQSSIAVKRGELYFIVEQFIFLDYIIPFLKEKYFC